jgi:hypothetical protein
MARPPSRPAWRVPPELVRWPGADLCPDCGGFHDAPCPAPVTAMPDGLLDESGELTPLGMVVEDAANYLAWRGELAPEDGDWPYWILAGLTALAREEPCGPLCRVTSGGYIHPSSLADHYHDRRQEEWEQTVPVWECGCGRRYKALREPPGLAFYQTREDGMLGEAAGCVELDAAGRTVKRSDACRGCGHRFADTITDRTDPQQSLFSGARAGHDGPAARPARPQPSAHRNGRKHAPPGPEPQALF